ELRRSEDRGGPVSGDFATDAARPVRGVVLREVVHGATVEDHEPRADRLGADGRGRPIDGVDPLRAEDGLVECKGFRYRTPWRSGPRSPPAPRSRAAASRSDPRNRLSPP